MVKHCAVLLGVVLFPLAAGAAQPPKGPIGQVNVYVTQTTLDLGFADDDGTGVGVNGFVAFGLPYVDFQYQTTSLDKFDIDVEDLRLGGGVAFPVAEPVLVFLGVDYVDLGSDVDEDGFLVGGGAIFIPGPAMSLTGALGYMNLNHTDGLELDLKAAFNFTKQVGAFIEYRDYMGSDDSRPAPFPDDFELQDIRLGAQLSFGM